MFDLPVSELIILMGVVVLYLAASVFALLQIRPEGLNYHSPLVHLIALAVVLEIVLLILRGTAIRKIPLTDLFESMVMLTVVFGIIYLILGLFIRQVWFSSVMTWVILILVLLTCTIARPAGPPHELATLPWAIAHGMCMILGAAMILIATATAVVYLLGCRRLKHKDVCKVIGVVPNIQKLERINLFTLRAAFVLVTLGIGSGIWGVWRAQETLESEPLKWLFDSKILGVLITWLILALVLLACRLRLIRGKRIAQTTIAAFIWIIFSLVGATILCKTKHDFSRPDLPKKTQSVEMQK
ncbi:MAG: cytochrome c biogenesis protein CcsA [Sedimentisphaerales bacterium]|nr:cytochrome c biogenesis protein CcsA [Sedimentisphaerales bacterium]